MKHSLPPQKEGDKMLKDLNEEELREMLSQIELPDLSVASRAFEAFVAENKKMAEMVERQLPSLEIQAFKAFEEINKAVNSFTSSGTFRMLERQNKFMDGILKTALSPTTMEALAFSISGTIRTQAESIGDDQLTESVDALVHKVDTSVMIDASNPDAIEKRALGADDFSIIDTRLSEIVGEKTAPVVQEVQTLRSEVAVVASYVVGFGEAILDAQIWCIDCNRVISRVHFFVYGTMECKKCKRTLKVPSAKVNIVPVKP